MITRLNSAVVAALSNPVVRKAMTERGYEIPLREHQAPEVLASHHRAEVEKWWPIIKAANIKGE